MSSGQSRTSVTIAGRDLRLQVRRYPAARGYRLRYDAAGGILRISMPGRGSERAAIDWALEQRDWIEKQMAERPEPARILPGTMLLLEGQECLIAWDASHPRMPRLSGGALMLGGPEASGGPRVLRWLKARALEVLSEDTRDIAGREELTVASVRIGDPRSRWGSCSVDGHIRYSWRLILAPPEVRRATVAHEVAHLLHMDHSPRFHAAHARLLGCDPAPARQWLRHNAGRLHSVTV